MKVNPTKLTWQAPTTNVDGTPIEYALQYELGVEVDGAFVPKLVVPAQLNADGSYEALVADMGMDYGQHTVALRTFAKDEPARKSTWSAQVEFAISNRIPSPPLSVAVY